jgi:hypothetical protein
MQMGQTLPALLRQGGICRSNKATRGTITVPSIDPVIERMTAYLWPRRGVGVRKLRGGYTFIIYPYQCPCRQAEADAAG